MWKTLFRILLPLLVAGAASAEPELLQVSMDGLFPASLPAPADRPTVRFFKSGRDWGAHIQNLPDYGAVVATSVEGEITKVFRSTNGAVRILPLSKETHCLLVTYLEPQCIPESRSTMGSGHEEPLPLTASRGDLK